MWKRLLRSIFVLIIAASLLGSLNVSFAASSSDIASAADATAAYIEKTITDPQFGSVGGEWAIIGLARSGGNVSDSYFQTYYSNIRAYVKDCGGDLSSKKYTEYSRLILALTAIGKNPSDVDGFNLLAPLGDYEKTIWQGVNGPIFALIALDSGNYAMPANSGAKTQATRSLYVDRVLSLQHSDGGFSEAGTGADPDLTAMALQALSKYQSRTDVRAATERALSCLSGLQNGTGGFSGSGGIYSESVSQAITALGEVGISLNASRFVKNGCSLADNLLTYYVKGRGFKHTPSDTGPDEMATEQAFYALVSALRYVAGEKSLYDMSDAPSFSDSDGTALKIGEGLSGKSADVKSQTIVFQGKSFCDISGTDSGKYETMIKELASRGIIGGYEDGTFKPGNTMTRAEFAAIIVRALGLMPKTSNIFSDIANSSWYAPYVGTANAYGIV
ncbi:MAG: S-layer homology domain-containing protein, partial [Oscillospiraceae bacterium]